MTIRGTLLGLGGLFWLAALICWLRGRGSWRLPREGVLFLLLGLPFMIAGGFYTASSYPGEVVTPEPTTTPVPVAATTTPAAVPSATPPPEPAPLTYRDAVTRAQHLAVERYPELGRAGTAFNSRYVAIYRQRRFENPNYFVDPDWPLHLADEVARTQLPPR